MKIARLLITSACNRKCSYCVDKNFSIPAKPIQLAQIPFLAKDFDQILFTGGEPLLRPQLTLEALQASSKIPTKYLYTAFPSPAILDLLFQNGLSGLSYTVHVPQTAQSLRQIFRIEEVLARYPHTNNRLMLDPTYANMPHSSELWKEVRVKYWRPAGELCLPPNETLFRLSPTR